MPLSLTSLNAYPEAKKMPGLFIRGTDWCYQLKERREKGRLDLVEGGGLKSPCGSKKLVGHPSGNVCCISSLVPTLTTECLIQ